MQFTADRRLFLTADKSRVVEETDPEAAFLLAPEGGTVDDETAKKYHLGRHAKKAEAADGDEADGAKSVPKAPDTKHVAGPPDTKTHGSKTEKGK